MCRLASGGYAAPVHAVDAARRAHARIIVCLAEKYYHKKMLSEEHQHGHKRSACARARARRQCVRVFACAAHGMMPDGTLCRCSVCRSEALASLARARA